MSVPTIGQLLLNFRFGEMPTPYTPGALAAELAAGVGKVLAGIGGNYLLTVDPLSGFIAAAHKDAVYNAYSAVADTTNTRLPALAITANGIAMGFNDVDGTWKNAVVIDATTGTATFSGAINATSGNFTGTVNAGSVIASSVTVNGSALGTISTNAATALSLAASAQNDATSALTALTTKLGASSSYVLAGNVSITNAGNGIKTGTVTWDAAGNVTGGSGIALTNRGIVGVASGTPTFSIDGTTGAAVFGGAVSASQITAGTITAAVSINSAGAIWARGVTGTLANTAIIGDVTGVGNHGIGGIATAGYGVYGQSGSGTGVLGSTAGAGFGVYSSGPFGTSSNAQVPNLNANYLQGNTASNFAAAGHTHAGVYADAGHNHSGVYLAAGGTAANSSALGGYAADSFFRYTNAIAYAGVIGGRPAYWADVWLVGAAYKVLIS